MLEELRRLGQGVELALVDAAWHQKVPRAFGGGFGQHRGFNLQKAEFVQIAAHGLSHAAAQYEIVGRGLAAQIQKTVLQAQILGHVHPVLDGKGRRFGRVQQFVFRDIDLDGPCRQLGVDHVGGPGADLALDGQDEFRAQHMGAFVRVGRHLRRENHLGQPETVAQVDENEPAVITAVLRPAHETDFLSELFRAEFGAGVRPAPSVQTVRPLFRISVVHVCPAVWDIFAGLHPGGGESRKFLSCIRA